MASLAILGGSSSQPLAYRIAKGLRTEYIRIETRKFPDGEKYARIHGNVEGKSIVLVQSMYHRPDEYLMEYFLIVDTLKDLGAKKVIGVIPYFAYARQDHRFNPGEILSLKTVFKLIKDVGTDELYVIDMHRHRMGDELMKSIGLPTHNLTAMRLLGRYALDRFRLEDPVVLGPDEEAEQWARIAAEEIGAEYVCLVKRRISDREVETRPRRELDLRGKDVLIVDDIVSTGGTMVNAVTIALKQGAKRVIAACTHPILVENALVKVLEAGAEALIGTDTVPSPISYVSVAPVIIDALRHLA
ncbi:MAG: ribose-phosphate diphosphokinase [Thermoprotei archaeon]|nr:ribose-phosphate diphosphokinase [Thermoprotei archaeon]